MEPIKIEVSKKANTELKKFTRKEFGTYEYLLRLMRETIEHYLKCEQELKFHEGTDRNKYTQAMRTAHEKTFTLGYIGQCLQLQIVPNWETKTIEVNIL